MGRLFSMFVSDMITDVNSLHALQAQKAQKRLFAREHANTRLLKHSFHNWKQCHANVLKDHSDKMVLALQFLTGQSLGETPSSCQHLASRSEPSIANFKETLMLKAAA